MTAQGEQMGDELRMVLSAVIAAVEPILGQLGDADAPAGNCTWCPVCALVALSRGEQHPLLTAISVHGVALLAILKDVLAESAGRHSQPGAAGPDAAHAGAGEPAPASRRPTFERISVVTNGVKTHGAGD